MTNRDAAVEYANRGWKVFPCHSIENGCCTCGTPRCTRQGKHPLTEHGFKNATCDLDTVTRWWTDSPNANIGLYCDGSGVTVIDVDPDKGGSESLNTMIDTFGESMLHTLQSETGGNGLHLFYTKPKGVEIRNKANNVLAGIDTRTAGYVILPPSNHRSGGSYRWLNDSPIADMPIGMVDMFRVKAPVPQRQGEPVPHSVNDDARAEAYGRDALDSEMRKLASVMPGEQNCALNRSAFNMGQLIAGGILNEAEVVSAIERVVLSWPCDGEAWTTENMKATLESGLNSGKKNARYLPSPSLVASIPSTPTNSEEEPPVRSTDDDAPEARNNYKVYKGQTVYCWVTPTKLEPRETVVADFWARVTRDVIVDDGKRAFYIEGKTTEGRRFSFAIDTTAFADDRALKAALVSASGSRAGVRHGQAGHLGPSIQAFTSCSVTTMNRLTRTGWRDSAFLIPGREQPEMEISLHSKLPYRIDKNADLTRGLEAFKALMDAQPHKQGTICISALLQAPLAHLCNWRNERYALMIAGQTGSLKTTWTQTAMCLYGPEFAYDERVIKWGDGATKNAICRLATGCSDLPFFVDNYKPSTGGGSKDFISMVHSLMEGGEKERLNASSELREARAFNCWPVFTGEDVPSDDAAALARVLIVRFAWQHGELNEPLTVAQNLSGDLCAVGNAWLEWLQTADAQKAADEAVKLFPEYRAKWAQFIVKKHKDTANALRIASNLATNQLAYWIAAQCPTLKDVLTPLNEEHTEGLKEVAQDMAEATATAVEADRYLNALQTLLASGRCVIWERSTNLDSSMTRATHVGYYDGDGGAFLFPEVVMEQVCRLLGGKDALGNISNQKLYAQLAGKGVLAGQGADKTTEVITVRGQRSRVIHVTQEAIGGEE